MRHPADHRILTHPIIEPLLPQMGKSHAPAATYSPQRKITLRRQQGSKRKSKRRTARYEVLKRAKLRCELCGVSADEKALEVDHIQPRNLGGNDELHNLQALCYSCNATKRDRDDTDFREVGLAYTHREDGCPFCELPSSRVVAENELALAFRDGFPVTEHHTLIIPKRHVADYFELFQPERNAMQALMEEQRAQILRLDASVRAFNVGVNAGADAGQTIFHCHMHLIPRRKGDVAEPRGGVRGVIPAKQKY